MKKPINKTRINNKLNGVIKRQTTNNATREKKKKSNEWKTLSFKLLLKPEHSPKNNEIKFYPIT